MHSFTPSQGIGSFSLLFIEVQEDVENETKIKER